MMVLGRFITRNRNPRPKGDVAQNLANLLDTQYIEARQANEGVRTLESAVSQIEARLRVLEQRQQSLER